MNERIRDLAEQARESATTRHPVSNITLSMNSDLFEQKFAELIVRECADLIDSMDHSSQYFPHVADTIKQHFGVE